MHRFLKVILFIFVFLFSALLVSPFISLLLPQKLTQRTYQRLIFDVIVDRQTKGLKTDRDKALKLYQYVVDHEFLQGIPYSCKPLQSLIDGQAWCDFQARTLNALLGQAGVESRYAMLLNKNNISNHTLNEVLIEKKWCAFDPALNIIYSDEKGGFATLKQLSDNPQLILDGRKMLALKVYDRFIHDDLAKTFGILFPMPLPPRRSIPTIKQAHPLDYALDFYYRLFKGSFLNFYQDFYLGRKQNRNDRQDLQLLFKARNFHLAYRLDQALRYYNQLLEEFPGSESAIDAVFFRGILYYEQDNYDRAIEEFTKAAADPKGKWFSAANYYLGKSYSAQGKGRLGLDAYSKVDSLKLGASVIEALNNNDYKK